ncbi:MAG: efflux RND transporter periplasmic adaptor subunit [Opitutaceae bacterium]|jgi:multidrug efflux system membrane fusion protein|nr:efflux RND transporter periplasmic adaptor subunit [Opitutaceae bacterium]
MRTRWKFLILAIALVSGIVVWKKFGGTAAAVRNEAGGKAVGTGIVVVSSEVGQRDVPLWLPGLGSVQAYNTVTVRPQVNGRLEQISFIEGQRVNVGDVLARIDPRPYEAALDRAKAARAQHEAQMDSATRELARVRALVESAAEGTRLLEQQEATVAECKALIQADDAAIATAQLDLDFTFVRAPIPGTTGVRMVDAGNLVTSSQATGIVVITQLQPISVVFNLPQQHLQAVRHQMIQDPSPLRVQALGDKGAVLAEGKLELIDNLIDASTGTVRLKATFENRDSALWPGQFVNARVLVETRRQATVVPSEVIQSGLNGPFAYVIKSDHTVEARRVTPGPTVEGLTIVEDGLKPGEKVVRDGQSKLQPGAKVSTGEHTKSS